MTLYRAHESAVIDPGAKIGRGTRIWHFSHICTGAFIGENSSIAQNVYVASEAVIGNRVRLQNNVSVYDGVTLEDEVFCGPSVVFTNVSNPRAFIERKAEYQPTLIRRGASLGANATIVCGVIVGRYAFVGAGAVVTQEVKSFALVIGVPAKQVGWISKAGERLELPLRGNAQANCKKTGEKYQLIDDQVHPLKLDE